MIARAIIPSLVVIVTILTFMFCPFEMSIIGLADQWHSPYLASNQLNNVMMPQSTVLPQNAIGKAKMVESLPKYNYHFDPFPVPPLNDYDLGLWDQEKNDEKKPKNEKKPENEKKPKNEKEPPRKLVPGLKKEGGGKAQQQNGQKMEDNDGNGRREQKAQKNNPIGRNQQMPPAVELNVDTRNAFDVLSGMSPEDGGDGTGTAANGAKKKGPRKRKGNRKIVGLAPNGGPISEAAMAPDSIKGNEPEAASPASSPGELPPAPAPEPGPVPDLEEGGGGGHRPVGTWQKGKALVFGGMLMLNLLLKGAAPNEVYTDAESAKPRARGIQDPMNCSPYWAPSNNGEQVVYGRPEMAELFACRVDMYLGKTGMKMPAWMQKEKPPPGRPIPRRRERLPPPAPAREEWMMKMHKLGTASEAQKSWTRKTKEEIRGPPSEVEPDHHVGFFMDFKGDPTKAGDRIFDVDFDGCTPVDGLYKYIDGDRAWECPVLLWDSEHVEVLETSPEEFMTN